MQRFTPPFADAAHPCRHATGDRWFVDETYIKVTGRWRSAPPSPLGLGECNSPRASSWQFRLNKSPWVVAAPVNLAAAAVAGTQMVVKHRRAFARIVEDAI